MKTCKDCMHYGICTFHVKGNEDERCKHFINAADVVEVVRCCDCKHWTPMDNGISWHNKGRRAEDEAGKS